jgi:hypothetical protein
MCCLIFSDALIQHCRVELERIAIENELPSTNTSEELHECKRCYAHFDNELQLKTHMLSICIEDVNASEDEKTKIKLDRTFKLNQSGGICKKPECHICRKIYSNRNRFKHHMENVHEFNLIRCNRRACVSYFLNEIERQKHEVQVHHGSEEKKCIFCGNFYPLPHNLVAHVKRCHKEAIRCDFNSRCTAWFHTKTEKDEHIHQVHNLRPEMKCVYCGKICRDVDVLRSHINHSHAEVIIKCRFSGCGLYFLSQTESDKHFCQEHLVKESLKKFHCPKCRFKTTKKKLLTDHVKVNHIKDKMSCHDCQGIFWSRRSLVRHMNYAHSKRVSCEYCGKQMHKFSLRTHKSRRFVCKICNEQSPCINKSIEHSKNCFQKNNPCADKNSLP